MKNTMTYENKIFSKFSTAILDMVVNDFSQLKRLD